MKSQSKKKKEKVTRVQEKNFESRTTTSPVTQAETTMQR